MRYIDYIKKRQKDMSPKKMSISGIYKGNISWINDIDNTDLKDFIKTLVLNKEITRQDVFDMYERGLYEGFIYTMLWGGLGLGPNGKRNLQNALSTPKEVIKGILFDVKQKIEDNDLEYAFKSMCKKKPNKISGVGISYLTKILYFLCQENNPKNKKTNAKVLPLIYDSKGMDMHAALLIDSLDNEKLLSCKYITRNDYNRIVETYSNYERYYDYLLSIQDVANKLSRRPGELEEFLFGYPQDKSNPESLCPSTNPRLFAKLYIQKYRNYLKNSNPNKEWSGISEEELNNIISKRGDAEDKKKNSKTKANNKQNHREEPTLTRDFTHDINDLKKQYPHLNVFDNSKKISGRKVYWGCDLSENLSLYVGRTYDKRTFCSIYRKEGIPQTIIEQLNDLLPKSYKDWIGKYCNYEEAVQTLYQVIDRLKITKG